MSKLSDYLQKHKIDTRRVLSASKKLEALKPEDRGIRLARERAKGGDEAAKELAAKKQRSGRAVTQPMLQKALLGKPLTRRARARVTRAINAVLSHKSRGEAKSADLF
jgi:hypothetical protein